MKDNLVSPKVISGIRELNKSFNSLQVTPTYREKLWERLINENFGDRNELSILHRIKSAANEWELINLLHIVKNLSHYESKLKEFQDKAQKTLITDGVSGIKKLQENNSDPIADSLYEQIKYDFIGTTWNEVVDLLNKVEIGKAANKFALIHDAVNCRMIADYDQLRENAIKKQNAIEKILPLLREGRFDDAREVFYHILDENEYPSVYITVIEPFLSSFKKQIFQALETEQYPRADSLYLQVKDYFPLEEYLQKKIRWVQKTFSNILSIYLSEEQARAITHIAKNSQIIARAGSGKTLSLACKVVFLIDYYKINPDQILVMAFNRSAANEIRNRIHREYKQPSFDNARTFHGLAHQLVQPTESLLYDDKEDLVTRKMTLFVQQLLKEQIRNPVYIEKMYMFFRKEMREIERAGYLLDDETYFDFRRNLRQITLNGERVKSVGEKIIADYLFEHDISYGYEKVWLWGSQIYRPDFSIYEQQKDFVIEHWGIDENDPAKQVPDDWSQTWEEYYAVMQAKRAFWNEKSVVLIETSIRDLRLGREAFEAILKSKIAQAGIHKPKLTSAELFHKIRDKDYTITRLTELFTQFIQRAKKKVLKAHNVQKLLQNYQPKDDREAVFLDLACRVYMEYEQALTRQQKIDFDDLMMRATNKVHETNGECEISLGNPKNRTIRMNDLRWILIDEYQDFSELFYRLITAIQKYNTRVQLFCVGDDWQAINGFAGSDLQFFNRFNDWVNDAQVAYLVTNFRSRAAIVKTGNALMQGYGRPGEHLPQNNGGDVHIEYMDDVWIELRNNEAVTNQKTDDERFLITDVAANGMDKKSNRIVASKYLKKCYQIITSPENQGNSIAILSRTNWIDGVRLNDFKNKLVASFTPTDLEAWENPKDKIDVQTAHKYKGLEADLVIILGACNGAFPLLHPDNALFEIFGKTLMDAFEEERRLFYVALTRAKSSLYILTEQGRESVFLKRLPGYQPSQSSYGWPTRSSQYVSPLFGSDEEDIPF